MSGQCNSPCATINERRRGMMNKFQGLIDCYDNAPFREKMRCPPATLREFPTLVERNQLLACYPVCCPAPCPPPCPPCPMPCSPCPPMCMPCPPPCPPPCSPCPPMCMPCPPQLSNQGSHSNGPSDSRELRGGVLLTGCDCVKRNGLQHDCRRSECQGSPQCLVKPWPDCKPSGGSGMKSAPPRVSNYPVVPEHCDTPVHRPRGPPPKDHEHRAGMDCEQCPPPPRIQICPPINCPKPKLNHHPTSRIPPEHTELKGGQLLNHCDCIHRNGLQDDCKLHGCGIPECLFRPEPECLPSGGRGPQGGGGYANGLGGGRGGNGRNGGNGGYKPCPSPCGPCPPPRLENCLVACPPCGPPCPPPCGSIY